MGKEAEICQLSAIDDAEQNEFSCYILPESNVSKHASEVNKLEIFKENGKRVLYHQGQPVESTSLKEAQVLFTNYINKVTTNGKEMKECIPVLVGHNAITFDIPILLRTSCQPFVTELKRLNVHFGDSLILAKQILKEKHPALLVSDNKFSKASLGCLYSTLFDQSFPAHDALEDVKALRRVLFQSNLTLTSEMIVSKSHVMSCENALSVVQHMDLSYDRFQTFIGNLHNSDPNRSVISKSMASKIAESGITFTDLVALFRQCGCEGIIAVLGLPPSTTRTSKPRVTRNLRILKAICTYFVSSV